MKKNIENVPRQSYFKLTDLLQSPLDLYHHLPFQISVVSNLLQLNRDSVIREIVDLEPRELRVILNIGSYMPIKSADIAYQSRLDAYTITRAVKKLNLLGLTKFKIEEGNKKTKLLVLTDVGIVVYQKLCDEINERQKLVEQGLTEQEKTMLMLALNKIENNLEQMLANKALAQLGNNKIIAADQKEIIRWSKKTKG